MALTLVYRQGRRRRRLPLLVLSLLLGVLALPLAGCGSESSSVSESSSGSTVSKNAAALLQQTFGGANRIASGVIDTTITAKPSGSAIINTPVTLLITGPFDDSAGDAIPASDLTAKFTGLSLDGSLGFISTGTVGYVSLSGKNYKLPAKEFAQLRDSLVESVLFPAYGVATVATSPLAQLDAGLAQEWRSWLFDPRVIDSESVNGVRSDHIAGRLDVAALLRDMRTLSRERKLSAAERARLKSIRDLSNAQIAHIAGQLGTPSFEVWAGKRDHMLRRIRLSFELQLNGSFASVKSAAMTVSTIYSNVNQPEQIVAPTKLAPFSEFEREVEPVLHQVLGSNVLLPQTRRKSAKPSVAAARDRAKHAKAKRAKAKRAKAGAKAK